MRALSSEVQQLLSSGYSSSARVWLEKPQGGFADLCDLGGWDFVEAIEVTDDIDGPHAVAEVTLRTQVEGISLAPTAGDSPVNRNWNPAATPAALLASGRELYIEVAVSPVGTAPTEWIELFRGTVDQIATVEGNHTRLQCRDLGAVLSDATIEDDVVYGLTGSLGAARGLRVWRPVHAFTVDQLVMPRSFNGHYYRCTVAGTSGSAEPTWPTSGSTSFTDGVGGTAVTWVREGALPSVPPQSDRDVPVEVVLEQMMADHLGSSAPSLTVIDDPAFPVRRFQAERGNLLRAMRRLVAQIGWVLRFKWVAGTTNAFELVLESPDRSKSTADFVFTPGGFDAVPAGVIDPSLIVNAVDVVFSDASALAADGLTQIRKAVSATDASSEALHGRRYRQLNEVVTRNVLSTAGADRLAQAMVSDLAAPGVDKVVRLPFFPWAQLGDLYQFPVNPDRLSDDPPSAVVRIAHSLKRTNSGLSAVSEFGCRGKSTAGVQMWHEMAAGGEPPPPPLTAPGGETLRVSPVPGGAMIDFLPSSVSEQAVFDGFELHISQSSATFAPDTNTFRGYFKATSQLLTDLRPGETYYARAVPHYTFGRALVVGAPTTPGEPFVAGYLSELNFKPELGLKPAPLNGGFESFWVADAMADHWEVVTPGIYRSNADVFRNATISHGGAYSMEFRATSVAAKIRSAYFPVQPGVVHDFVMWVIRTGSTDNNVVFAVEWYKRDKSPFEPPASTSLSTTSLSGLDVWTKIAATAAPPTDALFARITIAKQSATGYGFKVDDVGVSLQLDHTKLANNGTNTHAQIDTHLAASAPHSGHEVTSAKGAANGYASLDSGAKVPTAQLGAGTAAASKVLLGDQTWGDAPTGSPLHAQSLGAGRTTNSSTFASIASGSITTTKASQKIVCIVDWTGWANASAHAAGLRVNLNPGGSQIVSSEYIAYFNSAGIHGHYGFVCVLTGPATPGTYAIQAEWRRNSGSTATIQMDANDYVTLVALPL